MATGRLGRLPTIALAVVVPLVALITVVVTLNVTSDGTSFAAGTGAHAPNEYYVIDSTNPKVSGLDGAVGSFVEYLYALA